MDVAAARAMEAVYGACWIKDQIRPTISFYSVLEVPIP